MKPGIRQPTSTGAYLPDMTPLDFQTVSFVGRLGPGLVTGAADDDPSGIATYSQVGAQFGYGLAWTLAVQLSR